MSTPKRIQLRRTKGWRKPEGAIVVSRPSKFGNPFRVQKADAAKWGHSFYVDDGFSVEFFDSVNSASAYACEVFESDLRSDRNTVYPSTEMVRAELAGHDLACWCPLDRPCHADVLLKVANS